LLSGEREKELVAVQMSSCKFLLQLIDDIFDMSRMELNEFKLNYEWVSLKDITTSIYEIINLQAKMKNLKLVIDIKPRVP
jgi:signal transduction histidine kinase